MLTSYLGTNCCSSVIVFVCEPPMCDRVSVMESCLEIVLEAFLISI